MTSRREKILAAKAAVPRPVVGQTIVVSRDDRWHRARVTFSGEAIIKATSASGVSFVVDTYRDYQHRWKPLSAQP